MKFKVLLTRKLHDFAINELRKRCQVHIHMGKIPMPKKKLITKIKDKDGLICFPYDIIDSEVIDAARNLKAISTFSVGYDQIDVNYARKKGIIVSYTPEVLTKTTADLTFALILALVRRIVDGDRIVRKNNWKVIFGAYDFLSTDLNKKTLGILGMGRIGKEVAKRGLAFDMKILYHNRKKLPKKEEKVLNAKYETLNNLFGKSDILSIHVPYSKETHGLVNTRLIKKMKKTAYIVNTARGMIINEKDLVLALKRKTIAGAALDVYSHEPIGKIHPLTKMSNVVLSPHIGSSTTETRNEMAKLTIKNLILSLDGKNPIYRV